MLTNWPRFHRFILEGFFDGKQCPDVIGRSVPDLYKPGQRKPNCANFGATELVNGIQYCVSSVLPSQSGNAYGPQSLMDGDDRTAWCEGVRGNGEGQEISIAIDDSAPFRRLIVQNGYAKSSDTYFNNGRVRTIEIVTDLSQPIVVQLPDRPDDVIVNLPGLLPYRFIRIRILDVYTGAKYQDTCLNLVFPDLEYERSLEYENQNF